MSRGFEIASRQGGALCLAGIPVHPVTVQDVHAFIERTIQANQKALVLNVNIHCANLAWEQAWLLEFLNEAHLVFCDGDGVRWGARLLGMEPPPKVTYASWIWQLADFSAKRGYRIFFLGACSGVAEKAGQRLRERFPNLRIAGIRDGYFEKEGPENERVIRQINQSRPDILLLGFGMPLQEKWLSENWKRLNAYIFLTGGAVFDYASGNLRRAPGWMIRTHMEWLFRLVQEPRRLFKRYAFGNVIFFTRLLRKHKSKKVIS